MPSIYGFGGMLLVFALKLYPFIYMYVSGALKKIDVALSEAAESLGCGGLKKVLTVIMPLVTPTLIAAALLVFMNCMADFGTPALIGEGYRVMPTWYTPSSWERQALRQLCGMYGDYHGGSHRHRVLASEMVCEYQVLYHELHEADTAQGGLWNQRLFHAPVYLSAGSHLHHTPVHGCVHLLPRCKMQVFVDGFSLESYRKVFSTAIQSIKNTYLYCLAAIVIIVVLGMLIAYLAVRRKSWLTNAIDTIAMFPYIVPGSVLGITLLIAFNHPL